LETNARFTDSFHCFKQLSRRTSQSIQLPDNDRVTLSDLIEHPKKLQAFAPCAGYFLLKDSLAAGFLQSTKLQVQILFQSRYARITDFHGTPLFGFAKVVAKG